MYLLLLKFLFVCACALFLVGKKEPGKNKMSGAPKWVNPALLVTLDERTFKGK